MTDSVALITNLLNPLDEQFPAPSPTTQEAAKSAVRAYVLDLFDQQAEEALTWQPDPERLAACQAIIEHPVFICGFMKSGTTFTVGLLDGHPQTVTMPGDSHLVERVTERFNRPGDYRETMHGWIIGRLHRLINPTNQRPFWLFGQERRPYLDFIHYAHHWRDTLPATPRSIFLVYVLAFACANPAAKSSPRLWISKTPGNEHHAQTLLAMFPQARFIHLIRDPYPNLASMKKLQQAQGRLWDAKTITARLKDSLRQARKNLSQLGEARYRLLRYEDVLADPEGELRNLATWLGIAWDDRLTSPTVNGQPATSNSMFRQRRVVGEVAGKSTSRWRTVLAEDDHQIALGALYPMARHFGYRWPDTWLDYLRARLKSRPR
ncbi:MAG: sulfotransferase [Chloroflexi bacterium]|nr:sulfotransferase [Chloroflexota bacterium]